MANALKVEPLPSNFPSSQALSEVAILYLSRISGTDERGARELDVGALPEGDAVVQGGAK